MHVHTQSLFVCTDNGVIIVLASIAHKSRMAQRRSIVCKFFELTECERDGKTVKQAECALCPDTG